MSSTDSRPDLATRRLLAVINDEEMARRYPNGTHFIAADHPEHGPMATRALLDGDPVALVFPDGYELIVTPKPARGLTGRLLSITAVLLRLAGHHHDRGAVHAPPGARIEARDSAGVRVAA